MANILLDKGKMLTGKFGRRFMVKDVLSEEGRKHQIFELTESGKSLLGVAVTTDSARFKTEFMEKATERPIKSNQFAWPTDVFSYEYMNKKCVGYVAEKPSGSIYGPIDYSKVSDKDRYKIAYGIAKSFSKLHQNGYCFNGVPEVWINDKYDVFLVGIPVQKDVKYSRDDIMSVLSFSAPEHFFTGVARSASIEADRFLLASMLFKTLVGMNPYVELSKDPSYGYTRFVFSKDVEDPISDYGFNIVERWRHMDKLLMAMFIKIFTVGSKDPSTRFDESDWAHVIQDQITD